MAAKTLKNNLLIVLLVLFNSMLVAQNAHPDEVFGMVSKEHLAMRSYAPDTSANALYLLEKGVLKSIVDVRVGYDVHSSYDIHVRLKIFNKKALDEGNILIPYYAEKKTNTLKNFQIQVHYPDGTIKQVPANDSYIEDLGNGFFLKKVFIPDLQEGVVIEYRYYIEVEGSVLHLNWEFQDHIPRLKGVLEFDMTRNLNYDFVLVGTDKMTENIVSNSNSYYYSRRIVLENIPAVKDEPYTRSSARKRFEFRFKGVANGDPKYDHIDTWDDFVNQLRLGGFYKKYTRSSKTLKLLDLYENVYKPEKDTMQTIKKAQEFVARNIRWNGAYKAEYDLDEALSRKEGAYENISFALLACLQRANVESYPVLIKLRQDGRCLIDFVDKYQFETVAVLVKFKGESFLLDASNPYYLPGEVDEQILNDVGLIPTKDGAVWIDIVPSEIKDITQLNLNLDELGQLKGKVQLNFTGWLATEARKNLANKDYLTIAKDYFLDTHDNLSLTGFNCDTAFVKGKPLKIEFDANFGQVATVANDMIYLPALPCSFFEFNPFKSQSRSYPISFENPIRSQVIISYTLPEGYVVDELPKGNIMNFGTDGIILNYTIISPSPSVIQISYKMQLKTLEYSPEAYENLKQFFDALTSRVNDQIVLRKKS
jgi:hypothetical protein